MLLPSATGGLDQVTARVFDTATRNSGCRLDAYRIDDTYFIDVDLPGVDPAGIDVSVDGTVLTVRAAREHDGPRPATGRPSGPVARHVVVSDKLDTDRLEARYDGGALTLRIPIAGTAEPRRVEITDGDQAHAA